MVTNGIRAKDINKSFAVPNEKIFWQVQRQLITRTLISHY